MIAMIAQRKCNKLWWLQWLSNASASSSDDCNDCFRVTCKQQTSMLKHVKSTSGRMKKKSSLRLLLVENKNILFRQKKKKSLRLLLVENKNILLRQKKGLRLLLVENKNILLQDYFLSRNYLFGNYSMDYSYI